MIVGVCVKIAAGSQYTHLHSYNAQLTVRTMKYAAKQDTSSAKLRMLSHSFILRLTCIDVSI